MIFNTLCQRPIVSENSTPLRPLDNKFDALQIELFGWTNIT
jgi:hypothetical protein